MEQPQAQIVESMQGMALNTHQEQEERKQARHRPQNLFAGEPSYLAEFHEISSKYALEEKLGSEVSSDGEFDRAREMKVLDENDPMVRKIEVAKRIESKGQIATHRLVNSITNQEIQDGQKVSK